MKTKKIVVLLLALLLALAVVGCVSPPPPPPPVTPVEPPVEVDLEEYYNENENEAGRYEVSEFSDENILVTLFYDRASHTQEHIVGLTAIIANIGEERVVFQVGSGSNRVPDALQVNLEPLTALFRPVIQTMDMRHHVLMPGEYVAFELPFAPYMPAEETEFPPMIGFVEDLEFFQNEEWEPVPIGEYIGNLTFSYLIRGEGEYDMIVEGDEVSTVEGTFQFLLFAEEA